MGDVDSWYGRVVDVRSWMFDEGSWRRSSRWDTARCLMRVSWGWSSRWLQLDDRCEKPRPVVVGKLMSRFWHYVGLTGGGVRKGRFGCKPVQRVVHRLFVTMLGQTMTASRYADWMLHCWSVVVGRSMSRFWQYVALTRGWVSIWLLARTASRMWASCCNARAVRNSESLRGLDAALLERRGRNQRWQLGRVESSGLMTKTELCLGP